MHVHSCIKHVLCNSFLGHLQLAQKCSMKQHFVEWESLQRARALLLTVEAWCQWPLGNAGSQAPDPVLLSQELCCDR